jgi:hypothetical protein
MKKIIKSIDINNQCLSMVESSRDNEEFIWLVEVHNTTNDELIWQTNCDTFDKANEQFDLLLDGLEN